MNEEEWANVLEALSQSDASVAATAAEQLHRQATAEDLHRLRQLLNEGDAFAREAAAWPISEIVGPSSLCELLIAYQRGLDEGLDNDGFTTALVELVAGDPLGCRDALLLLAQSESAALRENADWLLDFCTPEGS